MARVVALVTDLMDRSRIGAALDDVVFVRSLDEVEIGNFDIVVIDLARSGEAVTIARHTAPKSRIVAFGPHVDDEELRRAQAGGADLVLPRSKFFRDVAFATFGAATDR